MRRTILLERGFLLLLALCAFSLNLKAQFLSGIEGTVTDPTGAVVPGAEVTVTNVNTGVSRTTPTNAVGMYRVTSLPAGTFNITVKLTGFKTVTQQGVILEVAQVKSVPITLEVGTVTQEVSVSAAPPPVETTEGRVSAIIEERKVEDLPLVGRNFYTLIVIAPGVVGLPSGGGQAYAQATGDIFEPEYGVNLSASGQRAESNSFLIDGANVSGSPRGGVVNVNPNADSVAELRVSVNNFSAEYGRSSSALINVVTKGGTNEFHGTLGFYHTDNVLQSRNAFQSGGTAVFRRNEYNASFGGPIWKDKTFFFASMDGLRSGVGFGDRRTVVTDELKAWLSANLPGNKSTYLATDPKFESLVFPPFEYHTAGELWVTQLGGAGCTGSELINIDTDGGDATTGVVPAIPCDLPVTQTGTYTQTLPRDGLQWNVRLDHNIGTSDRIYGNWYRTTLDQVLFGAPSAYPAFTEMQFQFYNYFNLGYTHIFSPTFINEASFDFVKVWGDAPVTLGSLPTINVQGLETYGGGWGPGIFTQNNFEWKDVASWNRGRHALKFGGTFQHNQTNSLFGTIMSRPNFWFPSIFDFAIDYPYSEGNIGVEPGTGNAASPNLYLKLQGLGLFVHDDWKVTQKLTLNLGLRWETYFAPYAIPHNRAIPVFRSGDDFQSRIADMAAVLTDGRLYNTPMDGWAPRFGLAWDPTGAGKMAIRAGGGVFYDRPAGQFFDDCCVTAPVFGSGGVDRATTVKPLYAFGVSDTPPFQFPLPPGFTIDVDERGGNDALNPSANVTDPNMGNAYSMNWFFGIQYAPASNWVFEANYVGSAGRNLHWETDVNVFSGDKLDGVRDRLNPSFGSIMYGQARAMSNYTGGTFSLKKRMSRGLDFQIAYTVGKATDENSSQTGGQPVSAENYSLQKGLSQFDRRQKLAGNFVYELPSPSATGGLNKLLAGWQVNGLFIFQSGSPFTVYCGSAYPTCDWNADGVNNDRPNTPASGNTLTGLTRSDYLTGIFTGIDFPAPAIGEVGNLGRNTFIGPGYAGVDFSLMKNTKIPWFWGAEGANVQFRTEFFNAFNRVNLDVPQGNTASSVFGKSTSAFGARDIQFGLKIIF